MPHTSWLLFAVPALALAAMACGSPDEPRREFVFTPIPYTVVPEDFGCGPPACGETIVPTGRGAIFTDLAAVVVRVQDTADFKSWLAGYGFEVLDELRSSSGTNNYLMIRVPPGSVFAAIELMQAQRGVIAAEAAGTGGTLQD